MNASPKKMSLKKLASNLASHPLHSLHLYTNDIYIRNKSVECFIIQVSLLFFL